MSVSARMVVGIPALLAGLLCGATAGHAQVSADSLSRAAGADSLPPAYGDTASRSGVDTAPAAAGTDTIASDTAVRAAPAAPADTTLASSCAESRPGERAPGLLALVFVPGTTDSAGTEVIKRVGGTPAGGAPSGERYVRLPPDPGLVRAIADSLALDPLVSQVSERSCP